MQRGFLTCYKLSWWYPSHIADLGNLFQVVPLGFVSLIYKCSVGFSPDLQELQSFDFIISLL